MKKGKISSSVSRGIWFGATELERRKPERMGLGDVGMSIGSEVGAEVSRSRVRGASERSRTGGSGGGW